MLIMEARSVNVNVLISKRIRAHARTVKRK